AIARGDQLGLRARLGRRGVGIGAADQRDRDRAVELRVGEVSSVLALARDPVADEHELAGDRRAAGVVTEGHDRMSDRLAAGTSTWDTQAALAALAQAHAVANFEALQEAVGQVRLEPGGLHALDQPRLHARVR